MLNDLKSTPHSTKDIELEWYEYLLREDHKPTRPPLKEISKNNNVWFVVFLLILGFGSISFLISFALTVLGILP